MKYKIVSAILCILILILILPVILNFPLFQLGSPVTTIPVENFGQIGHLLGEYLWTYRAPDVIAQAFIIFAASWGISALFRGSEEDSTCQCSTST